MGEEEKVEVEEDEEQGGVFLCPVSCILARPLTERSMGEHLE